MPDGLVQLAGPEVLELLGRLDGQLGQVLRAVRKAKPNMRAAAWMGVHGATGLADVSGDAMAQVRDVLQASLEEGWTKTEAVGELVSLGFDEDRAGGIYDNEIHAAREGGKLMAWLESVDAENLRKVWRVDVDPCPLCRQVDGQEQFLDEPFDTELGPVDAPPLHPNCRCGIVRVRVKARILVPVTVALEGGAAA